jgi:hypothetical protein
MFCGLARWPCSALFSHTLRELIERRPCYPRMKSQEREAAIKADVDRYWQVMQPEAVQSLEERHVTEAPRQAA